MRLVLRRWRLLDRGKGGRDSLVPSCSKLTDQAWGDCTQNVATLLDSTCLQQSQGRERVFIRNFLREVQQPVMGLAHFSEGVVSEFRVIRRVSWDSQA